VTGNHVQDEWRAPLDDLRTLRESLREEEQRVSYWRQLVQGRLDLVRTALDGGHPSADDLASLAAARPRDGARRRSPAATSLALDGLVSPLAGLEDLWDAPIAWDDPVALHRLERGLVEAEVKLSAYRRALHERIDGCTAQLVDHYQRDPAQIVR
jgi:RsiG-like